MAQPELFRILTTQHREVDAMLSMLAQSQGDIEKREALFPVLKQQLLAHSRAEEKVFYPAISRAGAEEQANEAEREHQDMEDALDEVESLDFDDEGWDDALRTLTERVRHHVQEEESAVFEAAREVLDDEQVEALTEAFREQRKELLESLGGEDDGYDQLTKQELMEEARDMDLPGRSGMSKEELIASLRAG